MQLKFSATTPSSSSWLPSNIERSRDPVEQEPKKKKDQNKTTTTNKTPGLTIRKTD